jgi:hypothetical protein
MKELVLVLICTPLLGLFIKVQVNSMSNLITAISTLFGLVVSGLFGAIAAGAIGYYIQMKLDVTKLGLEIPKTPSRNEEEDEPEGPSLADEFFSTNENDSKDADVSAKTKSNDSVD